MRTLFFAASLLFLFAAPIPAQAEISQRFGPIEVHYNALSSDFLSPEIARAYGVERSKSRGIVTMAILRSDASAPPSPVPAKVSLRFLNLVGQSSTVDLREIREGSAIYYLGEFRVAAPDTLHFSAEIQLPGEPARKLEFSQAFYR